MLVTAYIFCVGLLNTVPAGKPGLVQRTPHRIDPAALKRDLKTCEENDPERVLREWVQWLQDLYEVLELPIYWVWPFEVLEKCPKVMLWSTPATLRGHRKKDLVLLDLRRCTKKLCCEGVDAFLHFRMAFHISSCLLAFVRMECMILTADSAFPFAFG